MTRINVGIYVEELCNDHLVAEYRELPRALHPRYWGRESEVACDFHLGTGHMIWCGAHPGSLRARYVLLVDEMRYRGYEVNYPTPRPSTGNECWTPYDEAIGRRLLIPRIKERLKTMKPVWTRRMRPAWTLLLMFLLFAVGCDSGINLATSEAETEAETEAEAEAGDRTISGSNILVLSDTDFDYPGYTVEKFVKLSVTLEDMEKWLDQAARNNETHYTEGLNVFIHIGSKDASLGRDYSYSYYWLRRLINKVNGIYGNPRIVMARVNEEFIGSSVRYAQEDYSVDFGYLDLHLIDTDGLSHEEVRLRFLNPPSLAAPVGEG